MKNYRKRAAESFRSGIESPLEALGSRALRESEAELARREDSDPEAMAMLEEALAHEPRDAHEKRAAARAYLGVTTTRTKRAVRVERVATKDNERDVWTSWVNVGFPIADKMMRAAIAERLESERITEDEGQELLDLLDAIGANSSNDKIEPDYYEDLVADMRELGDRTTAMDWGNNFPYENWHRDADELEKYGDGLRDWYGDDWKSASRAVDTKREAEGEACWVEITFGEANGDFDPDVAYDDMNEMLGQFAGTAAPEMGDNETFYADFDTQDDAEAFVAAARSKYARGDIFVSAFDKATEENLGWKSAGAVDTKDNERDVWTTWINVDFPIKNQMTRAAIAERVESENITEDEAQELLDLLDAIEANSSNEKIEPEYYEDLIADMRELADRSATMDWGNTFTWENWRRSADELEKYGDGLRDWYGDDWKSVSASRTKAISQDVQEVLSCASSARDIGENAISGGRDVIEAAESLMDILNGDLDYNAYQDASSAIGDLIDALNGVEVEQPEEGYDPETDEVAQLQQDLEGYGKAFEAMSEDDGEDAEASAGAVETKGPRSYIVSLDVGDLIDDGEAMRAIGALASDNNGGTRGSMMSSSTQWSFETEEDAEAFCDQVNQEYASEGFEAHLYYGPDGYYKGAGTVETKSTTEDVYALADQLNSDLTEDWNEYARAHILMDDLDDGDEVNKASSAFSKMKRCIREIRDTAEDIDGSLELRGLAKELASLADRGLEFYLVDAIAAEVGDVGSERAGAIDELIAACEGVTA